METFFLDAPVEGFAALEMVKPRIPRRPPPA